MTDFIMKLRVMFAVLLKRIFKEVPSAPFWRLWLLWLAFNLRGYPRLSGIPWKLARLLAFKRTHQAMMAYTVDLTMNAIMGGVE